MNHRLCLFVLLLFFASNCGNKTDAPQMEEEPTAEEVETPFFWENAQVYFLLTDRFNNGDPSNDVNFGRTRETAVLRGFMGGDIKGITQKIEENYFTDLGVQAIWFTPVVEQIHGIVDEGTGNTYGYHGYWAKDWTTLDPNFGTMGDLANLVATAHQKGIRILLDVVINHTGPVTEKDPVWSSDWVRTGPPCTYKDYASTVTCTLVENLPDIKTDRKEAVELPSQLVEKWKAEGRYEEEIQELDAFFERTNYPRTPTFYLIKWLTDYIRELGVDGYRVDTAKHTEASVWKDLRAEADAAFKDWKAKHEDQVLDDNEFYMVGEVYNYFVSGGRDFDYGGEKVDFFDYGFTSLINFDFREDAKKDYESIFSKYSNTLNGDLKGKTILNYISSHDDGSPFDKARTRPIEAATKLLLSPGGVQTYYGDETARTLIIEGTNGDATLRSFMNWEELHKNIRREGYSIPEVYHHWQKLGKFREAHPAVGAGVHKMLSESPYVFSRTLEKGRYKDMVVVALDMKEAVKEIPVPFEEGMMLRDYYSGKEVKVENGKVKVESQGDLVLLGLDIKGYEVVN